MKNIHKIAKQQTKITISNKNSLTFVALGVATMFEGRQFQSMAVRKNKEV